MRAAGKVKGQATKTSQGTSRGPASSEYLNGTALVPIPFHLSHAHANAPVSGEILGPDGSVPVHQLPARLKLHRDEAAFPAEVVVPLVPVPVKTAAALPMAIIAPSRFVSRASTALNTSALAGLAMAFGLVSVDQTAFAPPATGDGAKSYTMRVAALPSLVLEPAATTVAHHVMAITTPASTFLPKLAESAQFLRIAAAAATPSPTRAHNHHLTPAPERATTQTTLASSTMIAAPGAVLGSLSASAVHTQRQGHHVGTALIQSDAQALAPPTLTRGVTAASPNRNDDARGKRNATAPSPIVPAVKRAQPTKEAYVRIDAATRQSLGAHSGNTAARAQGANADWRSSLSSQQ
jgi:hypothetical protein